MWEATSSATDVERPAGTLTRAIVAKVGWLCASGPALLLGSTLAHAAHLRLLLGRWPVVYRDTPDTALLNFHFYGLFMPALYLSLIGVPLWLVTGAIRGGLGLVRGRMFQLQFLLMAGGIIGVTVFALFDPTGYVEWLLD